MRAQTLLLRQVHSSFVQAGKITTQVFRPTSKDENILSVYDGDKITPENSWNHYTSQLNLKSLGVVAITNVECENQGLPVVPDGIPFPEHVSIHFEKLSKSQIEIKAKNLKYLAEKRGWLYLVEDIK